MAEKTSEVYAFLSTDAAKRVLQHLYVAVDSIDKKQTNDTDERHAIQDYDEGQNQTMTNDVNRNKAYHDALALVIGSAQRNISWFEIGPGAHAVLSLMALDLVRKRMDLQPTLFTVEGNDASFRASCKILQQANRGWPSQQWTILHGHSTDAHIVASLREKHKYDFFLSEIFGNILSQEAFPCIIHRLYQDGLLSQDTRVLPRFGATIMEPAQLSRFCSSGMKYDAMVSDKLLLWKKIDPAHTSLTGGCSALFEFYDFDLRNAGALFKQNRQEHALQALTVTLDGLMDSVVLTIWCDFGVTDLMPSSTSRHGIRKRHRSRVLPEDVGCTSLAECIGDYDCTVGFSSRSGTPMPASNWYPVAVLLPQQVAVQNNLRFCSE